MANQHDEYALRLRPGNTPPRRFDARNDRLRLQYRSRRLSTSGAVPNSSAQRGRTKPRRMDGGDGDAEADRCGRTTVHLAHRPALMTTATAIVTPVERMARTALPVA
jgi:hypothetical protein